jgi:N,N-dimethylformamidase
VRRARPVLRPPGPGRPRAPIAFLASTATYQAYGNARSGQDVRFEATGDPKYRGEVYETLRAHPELGLSMYDVHADGSGVQYSSRLRPLVDSFKPGTALVWGFCLDTLIPAWLERRRFAFDVITDEDLDREGADLLRPYRVVLTGAHPEYVSRRMRESIDVWLDGGGRLMYLGGNGFYWIVSSHEQLPGAIELRRVQTRPSMWEEAVGQAHHAFDGEPGGLWECSDRPQLGTLGVTFMGMAGAVRAEYEPAKDATSSRAAFALEGIRANVVNEYGGVYGALLADEYDRADFAAGTPPQAIVVATSKPQPAEQVVPASRPEADGSQADLVFLECGRGGAVFSFSTISWALGLAAHGYANDVCRVTENVLRRFLDPAPFADPPPAPERAR